MLFLSRKIGESIIINDNITLIIQEIRGNSVKIGFDYPKTTRILRKEVFEKIQKENKAAASHAENIIAFLEKGNLQGAEFPTKYSDDIKTKTESVSLEASFGVDEQQK